MQHVHIGLIVSLIGAVLIWSLLISRMTTSEKYRKLTMILYNPLLMIGLCCIFLFLALSIYEIHLHIGLVNFVMYFCVFTITIAILSGIGIAFFRGANLKPDSFDK